MTSIRDDKDTTAPSVFQPAALLREARRQKGLATVDVPPVCILDPDGDIVRRLRQSGRSRPVEHWPCYHTQLDAFTLGNRTVGIVGSAVGAPFAVLVAEELFASGCKLLVSPHLRRADRCRRAATLFRHHRPRAARRRHELSLHAAVGLQRG